MGKTKDIKTDIGLNNELLNLQSQAAELDSMASLVSYKQWCRAQVALGGEVEDSDLDQLVKLFLKGYLMRCERSLADTMTEVTEHAVEAKLIDPKTDSEGRHLIRVKFLQALKSDQMWDAVLGYHTEFHSVKANLIPANEAAAK
jgi:hypothetical protein